MPRLLALTRFLIGLLLPFAIACDPGTTRLPEVPADTITAVTAGAAHTCALNSDGVAYCWGFNGYGQLGGDSISTVPQRSPVAVASTERFRTISAGTWHTCALTPDGHAFCWGLNNLGQLGSEGASETCDFQDRPVPCSSRPVPVFGGLVFNAVAAGGYHTCALTNAGAAYCWGLNTSGQLGLGTRDLAQLSRWQPTAVVGDHTFTSIDAGYQATCAVSGAGQAYCWGINGYGELGNGLASRESQAQPSAVASQAVFAMASTGGLHTCAVGVSGAAYCWGLNSFGQIAEDSASGRCPTAAPCSSNTPLPVGGARRFVVITAGNEHTCALDGEGQAWCWGANIYGELGNGQDDQGHATTFHPDPQLVLGQQHWRSIEAGSAHTCSVTRGGEIYCWGGNQYGQLANATLSFTGTPMRVALP